jgi:hypothetical protein
MNHPPLLEEFDDFVFDGFVWYFAVWDSDKGRHVMTPISSLVGAMRRDCRNAAIAAYSLKEATHRDTERVLKQCAQAWADWPQCREPGQRTRETCVLTTGQITGAYKAEIGQIITTADDPDVRIDESGNPVYRLVCGHGTVFYYPLSKIGSIATPDLAKEKIHLSETGTSAPLIEYQHDEDPHNAE